MTGLEPATSRPPGVFILPLTYWLSKNYDLCKMYLHVICMVFGCCGYWDFCL